jgi:hypothetical protein
MLNKVHPVPATRSNKPLRWFNHEEHLGNLY